MIPVTKTFLPPIMEYHKYLENIWSSNQIANGGMLWKELKEKVQSHLNSTNLILTANGTLPLQIALNILAEKGEVITTPFSYVASTSAIIWENCTPVFVDIHSGHLTIDETKIEAAITEKTKAILATHVFGNPCNVKIIQKIALENNLKIIYDASHCFGVEFNNKSIFNYGDVSTCSFHATKVFHTGEGGAMFCANEELYNKLFYSHNFGHNGPLDFLGVGINAKMNELQAGMGLAVLPYVNENILKRQRVIELYNHHINFTRIRKMTIRKGTVWNFSYYPIIFENEETLLKVQKALNEKDIFPRRYFYPSLNTLKYVNNEKMEISEDVSKKILCLPVYPDLDKNEGRLISDIVNRVYN